MRKMFVLSIALLAFGCSTVGKLPAQSQCFISPTSATLPANGPGTQTFTINHKGFATVTPLLPGSMIGTGKNVDSSFTVGPLKSATPGVYDLKVVLQQPPNCTVHATITVTP